MEKIKTYEEFVAKVWELVGNCPTSWRVGQSVFNVIDENFNLARPVQLVDGVDCFYDDSKANEFIDRAWMWYYGHGLD